VTKILRYQFHRKHFCNQDLTVSISYFTHNPHVQKKCMFKPNVSYFENDDIFFILQIPRWYKGSRSDDAECYHLSISYCDNSRGWSRVVRYLHASGF